MNKGSKKIEGLAFKYIEGLDHTEVLQQANLLDLQFVFVQRTKVSIDD